MKFDFYLVFESQNLIGPLRNYSTEFLDNTYKRSVLGSSLIVFK